MHKVELKEVGLDIGLAFAKHFYKTDYLHYGYWPQELTVEPANVYEAQENYANFLLKNIPEGVDALKRALDEFKPVDYDYVMERYNPHNPMVINEYKKLILEN